MKNFRLYFCVDLKRIERNFLLTRLWRRLHFDHELCVTWLGIDTIYLAKYEHACAQKFVFGVKKLKFRKRKKWPGDMLKFNVQTKFQIPNPYRCWDIVAETHSIKVHKNRVFLDQNRTKRTKFWKTKRKFSKHAKNQRSWKISGF